MEKKATYTVMAPPHPCQRPWVAWVAAGVSVAALVVACVAAAVVNEQSTRVNHLEERVMQMESHLEDILRLTIASHEYDYLEYGDDAAEGGDYLYQDDQNGHKEEITVHRVLRRKRQVSSMENELPDPSNVPIYDQAYGIDLKSRAAPKGLRLYDSLLDKDNGDDDENDTTPEVTQSPIKPHHRVSNLWVPKKRRPRLPTSSGPPTLSSRTFVRQIAPPGDEENELAETIFSSGATASIRHSRLTERRSRTKSLHGSRRGLKRRQKQRTRFNPTPSPVVFRSSLVKATSRHDGFSSPNSVVPQPARLVPQSARLVPQPERLEHQPERLMPQPETLPEPPKIVPQNVGKTTPIAFVGAPTSSIYGKKRRKLRNKQHRRRRRGRPIITLAHFGASSTNTTTQQGRLGTGEHLDWAPAAWMDRLGLNTKYNMEQGTVTVREAGLYYIYAQVLYESGRAGSGFEILVDDIPILECQVAAFRPAPSCLTGGLSYVPRNGAVRVRDLDNNLTTVRRQRNTFFGLVKLMDAPHTAEELLLA